MSAREKMGVCFLGGLRREGKGGLKEITIWQLPVMKELSPLLTRGWVWRIG